jgi:hypothetical protein
MLSVLDHRTLLPCVCVLALLIAGCATDTPRAADAPLSAEERTAAIAALDLAAAPGGEVINDCGEATRPDVYVAELGGAVGRALLVVVGGGPTTLTCYGMSGMQFFLLMGEGDGWKTIFSGQGHLAVMESEHHGVRDIAVGGPGFEFPAYEWNGTKYVFGRMIPDGELPASLN